jgi:inner membrane protein
MHAHRIISSHTEPTLRLSFTIFARPMSTLLAHIAAGTAIYFSYSRLRSLHTWWALPCFVFLAVMPDFDYFAIWIFGIKQSVRITHTLLFCLMMGTAAWLLTRHRHKHAIHSRPLHIAVFLLAPLSHLLLDFSVGAHSLPVFWPLPDGELMSPVAILPAVIHTRNFFNPAMWRNFILETLVLLPVLILLVAHARTAPLAKIARKGALLLPLWCGALAWSLSLPR